MPEITHLFFDLLSILVDRTHLHDCYAHALGRIMADCYGLTAHMWTTVYLRIVADWDSYHADLDFGGEDGLAHMQEGHFRTTRTLFLTAGVPEPAHAVLSSLARRLPVEASTCCRAAYPGTKPALLHLYREGYVLGVVAQFFEDRTRAILSGSGLHHLLTGRIITPDVVGHFHMDAAFFRYAAHTSDAAPQQCCLFSADDDALAGAQAAGFQIRHNWAGMC